MSIMLWSWGVADLLYSKPSIGNSNLRCANWDLQKFFGSHLLWQLLMCNAINHRFKAGADHTTDTALIWIVNPKMQKVHRITFRFPVSKRLSPLLLVEGCCYQRSMSCHSKAIPFSKIASNPGNGLRGLLRSLRMSKSAYLKSSYVNERIYSFWYTALLLFWVRLRGHYFTATAHTEQPFFLMSDPFCG